MNSVEVRVCRSCDPAVPFWAYSQRVKISLPHIPAWLRLPLHCGQSLTHAANPGIHQQMRLQKRLSGVSLNHVACSQDVCRKMSKGGDHSNAK